MTRPVRMPRHVVRLPAHHLAVQWVLGSASSGAVVVEDAGLAIFWIAQSLFVGVLDFLRCLEVLLQEVLRRRELGSIFVNGAFYCNLQNRIIVGDERRCGGHRHGEQALGGIRVGDRQPGPVPIPLPLGTGGERVDGESLLPGLPGVEEEKLPLGRVLVPDLLAEGGGLGLGGREAEAGGGVVIHRMRSHVVTMDAGLVARHAGGQRLNKGPMVPRGGP